MEVMGFPVFTPAQSRTVAEQLRSKDSDRAKQLLEATEEILRAKTEAEQSFEETMQRQQKEGEEWFTEHVGKKNELKREVEELEERRKKALSPLTLKKKDLDLRDESLLARELGIQNKEVELQEESRILMRRSDEVSSRELDLDERGRRIKRTEEGARLQARQTAENAKSLNRRMAEFQVHMEQNEQGLAYRKSKQDARENLLDGIEAGFVKRENVLASEAKLLADQRVLLSKGFKELANKQK